jgi:predicted Zn-dependent protease
MSRAGSLLLVLTLALAGCVRSHFDLTTEHQSYSITSTDKEVDVGRKLARQVVHDLPLADDPEAQRRVQDIGAKIAAVCDRRELVYQFAVIQDKAVNAFSLPGGYVFVHQGLLDEAASDDELAGVIAHEVAHIAARHSVKRYESNIGIQLLQLATLATRQANVARGVSIGAQAAQLAYARQDELDADRLAVKYTKAAGFDPTAILTFLRKLELQPEQQKLSHMPRGVVRPQYARTHPYVPERMRTVKEALYGVADYIDYLNTPD